MILNCSSPHHLIYINLKPLHKLLCINLRTRAVSQNENSTQHDGM